MAAKAAVKRAQNGSAALLNQPIAAAPKSSLGAGATTAPPGLALPALVVGPKILPRSKPAVVPGAAPPLNKRPVISSSSALYFAPKHPKSVDGKPLKNFTEVIAIDPNAVVKVSPHRPTADRPKGAWIPGRATFYGASKQLEEVNVKRGRPAGQFGVIEYGSCGFTEANGTLPYPIDVYAAVSDQNLDYPGSCGRCYQVREGLGGRSS